MKDMASTALLIYHPQPKGLKKRNFHSYQPTCIYCGRIKSYGLKHQTYQFSSGATYCEGWAKRGDEEWTLLYRTGTAHDAKN